MLMHKIRSHMRASDVCLCVQNVFGIGKMGNYMCAASSISLMWICIDVNDAMGDTSTPARQNSTAHWANTLMVNKNKLCARSLVRIWITTTTTTARMYLQRSNRFLLTMMWMRCWRWWQCCVFGCVWRSSTFHRHQQFHTSIFRERCDISKINDCMWAAYRLNTFSPSFT